MDDEVFASLVWIVDFAASLHPFGIWKDVRGIEMVMTSLSKRWQYHLLGSIGLLAEL